MTKTYQGHRSWNAWNVSLWINNDEDLYKTALYFVRNSRDREDAACRLLASLRQCGTTNTKDGAPFTKTTIREAMRGME